MNPRTLQETVGDWVQDQEDRAEGFLGALEDAVWIWDDTRYSWYQRSLFKQEEQVKEKEKGRDKVKETEEASASFSNPDAKETEREKENTILLMRALLAMKSGKNQINGMMVFGPI